MSDIPWFRVHFRGRKFQIVEGEAELARVKARKVPRVIMVEPAPAYVCATCGVRSAWPQMSDSWADRDRGWRWFGRRQAYETGQGIDIYCSRACEPIGLDRYGEKGRRTAGNERCQIHMYEPIQFDSDRWKHLNDARESANHRRFPMPAHARLTDLGKREGQCRWCGGRITTGHAWQRSWHRRSKGDERDCQREWLLHTDREAQWWFLAQRDGIGCALLGKRDGRWIAAAGFHIPDRHQGVTYLRWSDPLQVDHIIPLWEVAHLPDEERRAYFGPDNLCLLSEAAHRQKSALEAAERAAMARKGDHRP